MAQNTTTPEDHGQDLGSHSAEAALRVRPQRLRRFATIAALCLAILAGGTVGTAITAAPAAAMDIGGIGALSPVPGSTGGETGCTRGRLAITPYASVNSGYTNGQYMSYRYYLSSSRGHAITSGWSNPQLVPTINYFSYPLATSYIPAALNTQWWTWVEVSRWNGRSWVSTGWMRTAYTGYAGVSTTNCFT